MQEISSEDVPEALGPYSQGIISGDTVHVSGKSGEDPETGDLPETVVEETKATLRNVETVLEAAGTTADSIVEVTVYLTDMDDYEQMNEGYRSYLSEPYPARTCVEVSRLPAPISVEVTATAELDGAE